MTAHEDEDDRHREDPQRRRGRSVLATVEDCDDEIGQYGEHGRDEDPDGEKVLEAAPVETSHDVSPALPEVRRQRRTQAARHDGGRHEHSVHQHVDGAVPADLARRAHDAQKQRVHPEGERADRPTNGEGGPAPPQASQRRDLEAGGEALHAAHEEHGRHRGARDSAGGEGARQQARIGLDEQDRQSADDHEGPLGEHGEHLDQEGVVHSKQEPKQGRAFPRDEIDPQEQRHRGDRREGSRARPSAIRAGSRRAPVGP
jgi:hypothetical protein